MNKPKSDRNTSGYKGVYWHKGAKKWMAQVQFKRKIYYIGLFEDKENAALAYNEKACELTKTFAYQNRI